MLKWHTRVKGAVTYIFIDVEAEILIFYWFKKFSNMVIKNGNMVQFCDAFTALGYQMPNKHCDKILC